MDDALYFNEQHHQVREMVREFSRTHIAPVARELDQINERAGHTDKRLPPARRQLVTEILGNDSN